MNRWTKTLYFSLEIFIWQMFKTDVRIVLVFQTSSVDLMRQPVGMPVLYDNVVAIDELLWWHRSFKLSDGLTNMKQKQFLLFCSDRTNLRDSTSSIYNQYKDQQTYRNVFFLIVPLLSDVAIFVIVLPGDQSSMFLVESIITKALSLLPKWRT